jgi:small subunit ribosomal protein S20
VANSRSARKRIRSSERKHERNRAVRSAVRTKVTKARRALLSPVETVDSDEALRAALSALDRASEKGILHTNNARRRKSRLATMAASLHRAGEAGEGEAGAARSTAAGGAKGRSTKAAAAKPAAKPAAKRSAKAASKSPAKAAAAKSPAGRSAKR